LKSWSGGGFDKLDRRALDEVVDRVNRWYDALLKNLAG